MHRREGNFVPSHLRRAPKREPVKRVLSIFEAVAIAALVVALLARMTLAQRAGVLGRGDANLANATAPPEAPPWNATSAPSSADDDGGPGRYDDAPNHHHHHHGKHGGVSFDDDDDFSPPSDDDDDAPADGATFFYR